MATVRLYLDSRTARKDGSSPLKLSIAHKGKTTYIGLNVYVPLANWDNASSKVFGLPNRNSMNAYLSQKRLEAENTVFRLSSEGLLDRMNPQQLKDAILGKESGQEKKSDGHGFSAAFRRFTGLKDKPRTRALYELTLSKLYAFCPDLDDIAYEEITKGWLMDFDAFLAKTAPSRNARNIHLRNIRAVFNFAIDEEYTTAYPFRRFKIRQEETRKRNLSASQLRALRDFHCEEYQVKYRDMFLLMFYLIGINPVDLFHARKSDVVDGRLEYRRSKTGKLYSIKIEPEAQAIIERYYGSGEYLLDVPDRYKNYHDFLARMNKGLKQMGALKRVGRGGKKVIVPLFPDLSAYWARHSWATIAYSLDVPKETISEALGHEIGSPITSIYIRFDKRKVDRANRKVIDFLNGNGQEEDYIGF